MINGIDCIGITNTTFCHDGEGNYLVAKRSENCRDEHGRWEPAGSGTLEFGETVDEALRREIKEEICADVVEYEFLGFRDILREQSGKHTHWLGLDFKVLVKRGQVAIGEPHKCDGLEWVSLDNIPKPWHSQFGIFLEKNKDKL